MTGRRAQERTGDLDWLPAQPSRVEIPTEPPCPFPERWPDATPEPDVPGFAIRSLGLFLVGAVAFAALLYLVLVVGLGW